MRALHFLAVLVLLTDIDLALLCKKVHKIREKYDTVVSNNWAITDNIDEMLL